VRCAALIGLLLLSNAACASRPTERLQQLYDSSIAQLWRGELTDAANGAKLGADLAAHESTAAWSWRFRLLATEIHLLDRNLAEAATLLAESPPADGLDGWIAAKHRYLQGQLAFLRGKPGEAMAILEDATRLAANRPASDVALAIGAMKGQALIAQRRWDEAEATLERTIDLARTERERYHEAVALVNLANVYLFRDRFDRALQILERVLAYKDLESQLVYAVALANAGICYQRLGELDRAIEVQRRAVASHEKPGRPRIYYIRALGELGTSYGFRDDDQNAVVYLRRAIDVAKGARMNDEGARWAANLARTYIRQRQWDLAETMNAESQRLGGERSDLAGYHAVNAANIALGRGRLPDAVRLFQQTLSLATNRPSLQWDAYQGLGRIAIAANKPNEAQRNFAAAIDIVERTRSELLKADYRLSFLTRLLDLHQQYIDLLVERGQPDQALVIADSSRGRVLAERHGVNAPARTTPAALRRAASDLDASLVLYWLGETRSYAWLVTATHIRLVRLPVTMSKAIDLARAHQQSITSALADPIAASSSPGDELYQVLIMPLVQWIPQGSRVVVSPDAALHTLNFETLPVPGTPRHYWIEDVEIAVAPSLGNLQPAPPAPPARERSVLLIGDAVSADAKYPTLRYASAEMSAISTAFSKQISVYRADQATPARYLESQPARYDVVHFTAHADANMESPLDSAVILSRGQTGYKLYARDVAEQPLNAELVTISACRSAGERTYAGEGLVGFSWAFLRAGAKRVIAGLWDVDDRSTAELMGRVYQKIAEGMSPGVALRAAKLDMIAKGGAASKPYYWGPFELFIGSRVVP
jgi:CHAT domain-containing protein